MFLNEFISMGALGVWVGWLAGWLGVTSCRVLGIRGCSTGNFECHVMVVCGVTDVGSISMGLWLIGDHHHHMEF